MRFFRPPDCSADYSPSLLDTMRHAVQSSNALSMEQREADFQRLTLKEAFMMATLGGAKGWSAASINRHCRWWTKWPFFF